MGMACSSELLVCVSPPVGAHSRCSGKHPRLTSTSLVAQVLATKATCIQLKQITHLVCLSAAFSKGRKAGRTQQARRLNPAGLRRQQHNSLLARPSLWHDGGGGGG